MVFLPGSLRPFSLARPIGRANGPEHPVDKLPLLPSGPGGVRECSVARDRPFFSHKRRRIARANLYATVNPLAGNAPFAQKVHIIVGGLMLLELALQDSLFAHVAQLTDAL